MLDYRGVIGLRTSMTVAVVAAVAGCATAAPPPARSSPADAGRTPAVVRCSEADPDRFAWFCLIGRTLYSIAAGFQTDYWRAR